MVWHRGSRNKYGAKKVKLDGYTFDSKAEAARYQELCLLVRCGRISGLRVHPRVQLEAWGMDICVYIPDFVYAEINSKGQVLNVAEDVKGFRTPEYKLKAKLFKAQFPRVDFREVSASKGSVSAARKPRSQS